jgi:phosphoserine aminotransferase
MLALSPRAVARLESHRPAWPLPKIFRLTSGGKVNRAIFEGATINTPSMLCVEDAIDSLRWAEQVGGLPALIAHAETNLATVATWVAARPWIDFLAEAPDTRSSTSICLKIVDPWFLGLDEARQRAAIKRLTGSIEEAGAGYDLAGHRDAPPGLRVWGGATVAGADIEALLPWLDWAFDELHETRAEVEG